MTGLEFDKRRKAARDARKKADAPQVFPPPERMPYDSIYHVPEEWAQRSYGLSADDVKTLREWGVI